MKLRRRSKFPDLRGLPLDGVDMFLLSRLDGELTLGQLVDLVPVCDPQETELRVYQLARLGLIEGPPVKAAGKPEASAPITAPAPPSPELLQAVAGAGGDIAHDDAEDLVTARPPAPQQHEMDALLAQVAGPDAEAEDEATLRPPPRSTVRAKPVAVELLDTDQTARVRPQRPL